MMKLTQLTAISALALLSFVGYSAFTASNTIPSTSVGAGSASVSGYTVSNVAYAHNASTPANVDSVSFTIAPATASYVKIQLTPGGSWYNCTNSSGTVSCATTSPQATAVTPDSLTVVASH